MRGLKLQDILKRLDKLGRIPYGMRGLKYLNHPLLLVTRGRIPYGMRGLKFIAHLSGIFRFMSHPVWDAWIEILH